MLKIELVNLHAFTENKNELTRDDFNSCPEAVYNSLLHNDVKILFEKFNTQIGCGDMHRGTPIMTIGNA